MVKPSNTELVQYFAPKNRYATKLTKSIVPIGIDTEAYTTGKMFIICTSIGDVWTPDDWPGCLFDARHREKTYVAYNLKYDSGALIQHLSRQALDALRITGRCTENGYGYRVIANKMLSIRKGHHYCNIFDMLNFYKMSLEAASQTYLGEGKIEQETKSYTKAYVKEHWAEIVAYCAKDAVLVARLAERLIHQLESWGLHVNKLYSTASVSYQWFASKCGHPSVGYFWDKHRQVLDMAMSAYSGGKFEVVHKGSAMLHEYDISSAYPYSIAKLLDLTNARVVYGKQYRKGANYGFIDCSLSIPANVHSPVAVKHGMLNTYPVGQFRKVITKIEYDYLLAHGTDATIHHAVWVYVDDKHYPYKAEIQRLYQLKQQLKANHDGMGSHTVKILLNSLYGKFVQLIAKTDYWQAGASWNPIYGAYITAETRVRLCELQDTYPSIWAVHTDSIISSQPLSLAVGNELGDWNFEIEGYGAVVACGVYQIGDKTALRGVPSPEPLLSLAEHGKSTLKLSRQRVNTWRQTLANGWEIDRINRFEDATKELRPNADRKRLWIDDYVQWAELTKRHVLSAPYYYLNGKPA